MTNQLPEDLRRNLLAKIHIAKKQLGLEEDAYRSLLKQVTGKESAKDLKAGELVKVLEEFGSLGFRVQGKPSPQTSPRGRGSQTKGKLSPQTRDKNPLEKTQVDKIRALWIEGYQVGVIKNRYEEGLNGFVRRMFKVERVEWLSWEQSQKCIEAIKAMVERGKSRVGEAVSDGDGGDGKSRVADTAVRDGDGGDGV